MSLERLDQLEARIKTLEAHAASDTNPAADARLEQQRKDIEALQNRLNEITVLVDQRLAEACQQIPALVDTALGPHIEQMRTRLELESRETLCAALKTLDQTIESRISTRMSAVERALITQSEMLAALSRREDESRAMIQRLASAIDRLSQHRSDASPVASSRPEPALPARRPPESQSIWPASDFRPRIVREDEDKVRHRKPLTRI